MCDLHDLPTQAVDAIVGQMAWMVDYLVHDIEADHHFDDLYISISEHEDELAALDLDHATRAAIVENFSDHNPAEVEDLEALAAELMCSEARWEIRGRFEALEELTKTHGVPFEAITKANPYAEQSTTGARTEDGYTVLEYTVEGRDMEIWVYPFPLRHLDRSWDFGTLYLEVERHG